jgi:hypothetical protein
MVKLLKINKLWYLSVINEAIIGYLRLKVALLGNFCD